MSDCSAFLAVLRAAQPSAQRSWAQVLLVTTCGDGKRTTWLTGIGRRGTDLVPVRSGGSKPISIHWQRQQAAVGVVGVDGRGRWESGVW